MTRPSLFVSLVPRCPVRFGPNSGARDETEVVFHSDGLYSALTAAMRHLGFLEEWISSTATATAPDVKLSSCFPLLAGAQPYLPVPRGLWPPPASSPKLRWKSVRFVSAALITSVLRSEAITEDRWALDTGTGCLLPVERGGTVAEAPFRKVLRSSAAVDRLSAGVDHHATACLEFARGAGLWTTVVFADEAARDRWNDRVVGALRLIGDTGIGGERTRGWGTFEMNCKDGTYPVDLLAGVEPESAANQWCLLSVYSPADEDRIDWSQGSYSVVERRGRIESAAGWGVDKLAMRVIEEGSVISCESEPLGAARNVAPDGFPHPVYRYGVAVAYPVPLRSQS